MQSGLVPSHSVYPLENQSLATSPEPPPRSRGTLAGNLLRDPTQPSSWFLFYLGLPIDCV